MQKKITPLISVCLIVFNHERYVAEAITSILKQTFSNFELIIVNDGSTDKTEAVINSFQDKRMHYIYQKNQGPSAALNRAIRHSTGKYLAFLSGDDIWHPDKLQKQYTWLTAESNRKIIFSHIDFIDDNSGPIAVPWADNLFNQKDSKSRPEYLRTWFFKGNCLNAGTCLVEKKLILDLGMFNLASLQLQDFDMWIKIISKYDIYVLPQKLMKYRIRANEMNLSSNKNHLRTSFEWYALAKNIFNAIDIELFKESFSDQLKKANFTTKIEYELEKAFLFLNNELAYIKIIGIEKLFNLLQNENILKVSRSEYNFDLPDLYHLTKLNQNIDVSLEYPSKSANFYQKIINYAYPVIPKPFLKFYRMFYKT